MVDAMSALTTKIADMGTEDTPLMDATINPPTNQSMYCQDRMDGVSLVRDEDEKQKGKRTRLGRD